MTIPIPVIEFICLDCGHHVVCPINDPGVFRCASCRWITENVPREDQAGARKRLGVPLREGRLPMIERQSKTT